MSMESVFEIVLENRGICSHIKYTDSPDHIPQLIPAEKLVRVAESTRPRKLDSIVRRRTVVAYAHTVATHIHSKCNFSSPRACMVRSRSVAHYILSPKYEIWYCQNNDAILRISECRMLFKTRRQNVHKLNHSVYLIEKVVDLEKNRIKLNKRSHSMADSALIRT